MSLNNKQIKSLEKIIDYMYDDEERSFEEDKAPDHIFRDIVALKRVLNSRFHIKY